MRMEILPGRALVMKMCGAGAAAGKADAIRLHQL
jgi:hypothetical protein